MRERDWNLVVKDCQHHFHNTNCIKLNHVRSWHKIIICRATRVATLPICESLIDSSFGQFANNCKFQLLQNRSRRDDDKSLSPVGFSFILKIAHRDAFHGVEANPSTSASSPTLSQKDTTKRRKSRSAEPLFTLCHPHSSPSVQGIPS